MDYHPGDVSMAAANIERVRAVVKNARKLIGKYQLDGDEACSFGRDRQYAVFQSPFQALQWLEADVLFADIDYMVCHHFPCLVNIACINVVSPKST